MLYAVLVAALVAIDQVVKYLVRANIPLGESIPFLPHVSDGPDLCTSTGAAFSMLSEHTWVLTLLSLAASVLLTLVLVKGWVTRTRLGRLCVAVVLAGAVGNLIDRALFRFVTDMFETTFINFAVFNVADICVVLGGIGFCAYYLFLYEKLEGKESGHDDAGTAGLTGPASGPTASWPGRWRASPARPPSGCWRRGRCGKTAPP